MTASCKIAACAALLAGCVAAPAAAAAPTLKVFVLAGQSNMEGQAEVSKVRPAQRAGSDISDDRKYLLASRYPLCSREWL
jgi:hypothetical protein